MNNSKSRGHMIDILFTLALFCMFAASALFVVLIGANVYKNTINRMNTNFNNRTSLTYVSAKIRQNDISGAVYTEKFGEVDAIVMEQNFNDTLYKVRIYQHEGTLRELVSKEDANLAPADGQEIMPIIKFTVHEVSDNLFCLSTVDDAGIPAELYVSTRS